jgi:Uncharacterized ACR, COG1678
MTLHDRMTVGIVPPPDMMSKPTTVSAARNTERSVPRIASRRFVLALVAFALPASLVAAPSDPAETPAKLSLKGQLLIATPAMRDPRFEHALILMVRHGQDGAMGIVINRPLGEQPLADLLAALGTKDIAAVGSVRVFLGGRR